jgi:prepilin-type N-terminal cleavage/methylation domain-containing protein
MYKRRSKMSANNFKGFSLLEMVVVVAILLIVGSVTMVLFYYLYQSTAMVSAGTAVSGANLMVLSSITNDIRGGNTFVVKPDTLKMAVNSPAESLKIYTSGKRIVRNRYYPLVGAKTDTVAADFAKETDSIGVSFSGVAVSGFIQVSVRDVKRGVDVDSLTLTRNVKARIY